MSIELISRITVKNGAVYIHSKSNNVGGPFHTFESKYLTEALKEGQEHLDAIVLAHATDGSWDLRGVDRYFDVLNSSDCVRSKYEIEGMKMDLYHRLTAEDRATEFHGRTERTPAMENWFSECDRLDQEHLDKLLKELQRQDKLAAE